MAIIKRTTVTTTGVPTIPTETIVTRYHSSDSVVDKINYLLYVILSFLEFFILARLVLKFLGANQVGIVQFIYDCADPFIKPFIGILGRTPQVGNGTYIEWEAVIAAIFWAMLFSGFTLILNLFKRDSY